jgi:hypothetical protein
MNLELFNLKWLVHILGFFVIPVVFFYIIFAFVVVRQVKLLNRSFSTPLAPVLASAATAQLIISIVIAAIALMNL